MARNRYFFTLIAVAIVVITLPAGNNQPAASAPQKGQPMTVTAAGEQQVGQQALNCKLTIDVGKPGAEISPTLYGAFFEVYLFDTRILREICSRRIPVR